MFELEAWLSEWRAAVMGSFAGRVRFLGIQGSRARGEARDESDIDAVLVLDKLAPGDVFAYRSAVAGLPERDKLCGFVSGWDELESWPGGELWQFCLDTEPLYGSLAPIAARLTESDVRESALTGAGAVYHGCIHNLMHGQSEDVYSELLKSAFFALRAVHALRTGDMVRTRAVLASALTGVERSIVLMELSGSLEERSAALLDWAGGLLRELRHIRNERAGDVCRL